MDPDPNSPSGEKFSKQFSPISTIQRDQEVGDEYEVFGLTQSSMATWYRNRQLAEKFNQPSSRSEMREKLADILLME